MLKRQAPSPQIHFSDQDIENLRSRAWRRANLYKIQDKNGNLVLFTPNRAQQHYAKNAANRNLILKSRQLGFTTDAALNQIDATLFNQNFHSLFISYDELSALSIFDNKIKFAWDHFPFQSLYTLDADRSNKLKFDFGDKTFSEIEVRNSGRSGTFQYVHISEFAKICAKFPGKATEIITGTFPSVPLDGRLDIESTAEGDVGDFAEMFWEAWSRPASQKKRPTEFKAHFYNWQWDDAEIKKVSRVDAQIPKEFRDYQKKHNELARKFPHKYIPIDDIQLTYYFYCWLALGKKWDKLKQEYPTTPEEAFVASGSRVFEAERIAALEDRCDDNPEVIGDWTYFEPYVPGHVYALGADVAGGEGRDHSAIVIWDFTPLRPKVVATYTSNTIAPDIFAYEIRAGGLHYGTCLVAPELNNMGYATITKLKEIYPVDCIYTIIKEDRAEDKLTDKLGWESNLATKPKMVYDMVTAIREDIVDVPSKAIVSEMRTYNRNDMNTIKPPEGQTKHYDLLTATMIGFQMRGHTLDNDVIIRTVNKKTTNNLHSAV